MIEDLKTLRDALNEELKFLETCFDTWMDREASERRIAKLVTIIANGSYGRVELCSLAFDLGFKDGIKAMTTKVDRFFLKKMGYSDEEIQTKAFRKNAPKGAAGGLGGLDRPPASPLRVGGNLAESKSQKVKK